MIMYLKILSILVCGMALGWTYCYLINVRKLKAMNKSLRKIEIEEIMTSNGSIMARTSEWPVDAQEYLAFHSLEPDGGNITITYKGMEDHLNVFASHMTSRQKRDFMKMLKQIRGGRRVDMVIEQLNSV